MSAEIAAMRDMMMVFAARLERLENAVMQPVVPAAKSAHAVSPCGACHGSGEYTMRDDNECVSVTCASCGGKGRR